MRVFFDASVIIAALLSPSGGSALLLQFVQTHEITGFTSQTVIDETLEEDKPEKLNRPKEEIERFIAESGLIVREAITPKEIEPYQENIDKEDAHLVAGANLTKCTYLVSLDKKHVLAEGVKRRFLPLKMVSPKELLEELAG